MHLHDNYSHLVFFFPNLLNKNSRIYSRGSLLPFSNRNWETMRHRLFLNLWLSIYDICLFKIKRNFKRRKKSNFSETKPGNGDDMSVVMRNYKHIVTFISME